MALTGVYEYKEGAEWDYAFVEEDQEFFVMDNGENFSREISMAKEDLGIASWSLEEPLKSFCLPLEFFDLVLEDVLEEEEEE